MANLISLKAHVPESKYHPLIVSVSDCPSVNMIVPVKIDMSPISNAKAYRLKVSVDADTAEKISSVEADVVEALGVRGKEWFATEQYSPDDHLVPAIRYSSKSIEARFMIDKELPTGTISVNLYVTHMIVSETGLKLMWTFSVDESDADIDFDAEAKLKAEKLSKKISESKQKVAKMIEELQHANLDDQADWLLKHDLM